MRVRILLIEDDLDLADFLLRNLHQEHVLDWAKNIEQAKFFCQSNYYDLLILDLYLPDGCGMDFYYLCLEKNEHLNILFLTAKFEQKEKLSQLKQQSRDFLLKPFSLKEMLTKLELLKDRIKKRVPTGRYRFHRLRLDTIKMRCWLGKEQIFLTKKEFQILELLFQSQPRILKREILANQIWYHELALNNNTVATHICSLRNKLNGQYVKNIRGIGYCLK